jgi:hypothetical protein
MSALTQPGARRAKIRWFILAAAIAFALAAWTAVIIVYFMHPGLPVWAGVVSIGAISLEVLMWSAAGVFAWGFLDKRRAKLARWRDCLTGKRPGAESDAQT